MLAMLDEKVLTRCDPVRVIAGACATARTTARHLPRRHWPCALSRSPLAARCPGADPMTGEFIAEDWASPGAQCRDGEEGFIVQVPQASHVRLS